ncbi:MAG: hypothetical protein N838_14930 [Thiohalocapsa sp. PB-PSB1]|nr:MAG: hypothetical protein N838_03365 [Thiohalocapsa sp. PB-PSB1]QQO54449.1 MAG: hypothetical protein N838_14930 [Thiohalocapsa sp. PB-PSB1]
MSRYRISVRIRLQGPVLSQATGGRDIGLDAAALRDVHGTPLLPGNLIRGNLRHAWHRLREIAEAHGGAPASLDPDSWLGAESKSDSNDAPIRARLCFSPYWRAEQPADGGVRHRIAVDPQTGAVSNMALQVVDTPFLPGDEPSFVGTVEADLEDQGAADELAERIRQGLEFAGNLGALKGVGFGRVLAVDVESAACRAGIAQSAQIRGCDRIGISLTLDRPFCIARPHGKNNLFESEDFIPGGVLRGALARRLFKGDDSTESASPAYAKLCEHFEHLAVSHALPVTANAIGSRPIATPFSLVQAPEQAGSDRSAPYDIACKGEPAGLIHGRAPAFEPDWKHSDALRAMCGQTLSLSREIAVQTRIHPKQGTAEEGNLFATEAVCPHAHLWRAHIDISQVPLADRPDVLDQLAQVFADPLTHIGKTKAQAVVELSPTPDSLAVKEGDPQTGKLLRDGIAIVCLQSDALLLPDFSGLTGTGGSARLQALYAGAWEQLSAGALALDGQRYFARQALVGGNYLHHRFSPLGRPYNPWLITLAGSVFVLKPTQNDPQGENLAENVLQSWRQTGLAQVYADSEDAATRRTREHWKHNPYLRQNGYGAVAVNLALHWNLDPQSAWQGMHDRTETTDDNS